MAARECEETKPPRCGCARRLKFSMAQCSQSNDFAGSETNLILTQSVKVAHGQSATNGDDSRATGGSRGQLSGGCAGWALVVSRGATEMTPGWPGRASRLANLARPNMLSSPCSRAELALISINLRRPPVSISSKEFNQLDRNSEGHQALWDWPSRGSRSLASGTTLTLRSSPEDQ